MRANKLELWGGLECTINRVGDLWFDQVESSGHFGRPDDLDRIAALGFRKLRYGLNWERFCKSGSLDVFVRPLQQMQQLRIEPIAGLLHHGSGPADTDLLDPHFPQKLAGYARLVALRFPHLCWYTPVNEPGTTARFSALNGFWYPHETSFTGFARALVQQVKATVLSMRAIRSVQPRARLISTEDGGRIWATEPLQGIAGLREARRWAGVDLLCGRVDRQHPMHAFLTSNGIAPDELRWFADNPCPPDIIGLNYYLTSDRFLDHDISKYPETMVGGDTGSEPLADVEAVRLREAGIHGASALLTEAWERYGIPVAITECHLAGGWEGDTLRWLDEVWTGAQEARAKGADVAAVTVWALLGAFDWDSLVTLNRGNYEPGVFDLTGGHPMPTALASAVRRLADGLPLEVTGKGWWHHPKRFTFPSVTEAKGT